MVKCFSTPIKGGLETNVAMLSTILSSMSPLDCPGRISMWAERFETLTNMFTHGFAGDVCTPPYDAFFIDAVSVVTEGGGDFMPPPE